MSNGDNIIQAELDEMIEDMEAAPDNDKARLVQLRVLSEMWGEVSDIREYVRKARINPSLIYLLRYKTAKAAPGLFVVFGIFYIVFSTLECWVGWEDMLGMILP